MTNINIQIDPELHHLAKEAALKDNITLKQFITKAIERAIMPPNKEESIIVGGYI